MKHFSFLVALIGLLGTTQLFADELNENTETKTELSKYLVSMTVEEINSNGENKVIASPVFECTDGAPAKVSLKSSNLDQSNQKSIVIEAKVNCKE